MLNRSAHHESSGLQQIILSLWLIETHHFGCIESHYKPSIRFALSGWSRIIIVTTEISKIWVKQWDFSSRWVAMDMVIWTHSLAHASVFLTIEKQSHWLSVRIRNRCWSLIRKEKMNNALAVDWQNKWTRIQEGFGEILHVYLDDSCHNLKLGHLISSLLFSSTHRLYLGRAGSSRGRAS